jgi:hypothetical protein
MLNKMQDKRWNDPNQIPMTNGPYAQVTPPPVARFRLAGDGQIIEFLVSFPIHIVDEQPWASLQCKLGTRLVSIQKPLCVMHGYHPPGRIGNQVPDAFCSIIRVHCPSDVRDRTYPKPSELWPLVERLLRWMRVKARHYWLLHGYTGFDSLCRGSVLIQDGSQIGQRNFAIYGSNLIVCPIEQDLWLTFTNEINSGAEPPASESIFCDALISAVTGDEVKAVLELGVAAEVEITRLLADVSCAPPATHQKNRFSVKGEWDSFYKKLKEWPKKLGLQEAQSFDPIGRFKDWLDLVLELYRLRGGVAHSGKLGPILSRPVTTYLMATNILFAYAREQRRIAGVPVYSYPEMHGPFEQIVAFTDGVLSSETNTAIGPVG